MKNLPAPEAVLIDLDGVIYPFDHTYKTAVRRAASSVLRRTPLNYFNGIGSMVTVMAFTIAMPWLISPVWLNAAVTS